VDFSGASHPFELEAGFAAAPHSEAIILTGLNLLAIVGAPLPLPGFIPPLLLLSFHGPTQTVSGASRHLSLSPFMPPLALIVCFRF
jgi:hypothetical protein